MAQQTQAHLPLELPLPGMGLDARPGALLGFLRAFLVPWEFVYIFPMRRPDAPRDEAVAERAVVELAVVRGGAFVRIGRAAARVLGFEYDERLGGVVDSVLEPRQGSEERSAADGSFGAELVEGLVAYAYDDVFDPVSEKCLKRCRLPREALFAPCP